MKRNSFPVLAVILAMVWFTPAFSKEEGPAPPDLAAIEVLDLETAQQIALASNPDMTAALARVEQARARVRQAAAAWWPELNLTGNASRIRLSDSAFSTSSTTTGFFPLSFDRTQENYTANLQASWTVFDGFYRTFNERQARFGEKSTAASRKDAQRLLAAAVAESFLNAQMAQTNTRIAEADRDFYSQQLRDARNRYEVGAGRWGDVLNIKVQLNTARTSVLVSSRQMEADMYGLAALLGLENAALPGGMELQPLDQEADVRSYRVEPETLISRAQEQRPDIRSLDMAIRQADALAGRAEAAFYPRLELAGSVNGAREGDIGFAGDDFGNSIGLSLSWNLFSGGADRARQFEAEQARREINYTLLNLRNEVASEVRQGVALLEAAREQVELQRQSVKLVEENRDLARTEYEAGEASLVRLNEAQRDLTATYGRLAQAVVAFYRAKHRLLAATAGNLENLSYREAGSMQE